MEIAQLCDLVELPVAEAINGSELIGDWVNANAYTTSIARVKISGSAEKLLLRVLAVGPEGLIDWGAAELMMFSSSPSTSRPGGFICHYDFGCAETELKGMIMKGLLVLAQFHRFKDHSDRANYFVREYFGLMHGKF